MNITIDEVIESLLVSLYSDDFFNETLYLKGGQAVRLMEDIKDRFSKDSDFSVEGKIDNDEQFFSRMRDCFDKSFYNIDLAIFDFQPERRPKFRGDDVPDFWGGWRVNFKLIPRNKMGLDIEARRREAIIPVNSPGSKIEIDISEYEYCESSEKVEFQGVLVKTYSRPLLVAEKIRAICQAHSSYELTSGENRVRDFYDIERLYSKSLKENNSSQFKTSLSTVLPKTFKVKDVPLSLLTDIFEKSFLERQSMYWELEQKRIQKKVQDFDYYVEVLKDLVQKI